MAKKKFINPKKLTSGISEEEQAFINAAEDPTPEPAVEPEKKQEKTKNTTSKKKEKKIPYNFSMTPTFHQEIARFIEEFPEEGTMSSVVTRALTIYMREKQKLR